MIRAREWKRVRGGMSRVAITMIMIAAMAGAVDGRGGAESSPDGLGYLSMRSECGPFAIHFPERNRKMASEIEGLLCEAFPEITAETGLSELLELDIYVASGREDMEVLSGGSLPEWGEAFSNMRKGIIVIDAVRVLRTPRPLGTVIRHELSHIVLAQKVRGARMPTWFVEGLAMRQSREWTMMDQWRLMTAIWTGALPDLEDIENGFPAPAGSASAAYNVSYAAVEKLLEERPEDLITLLSFTRDLGDFDRAFVLTFGESKDDFTAAFHLGIQKRYGRALPLLRSPPFWLILTALFLLAYILRRIRNARKLKEWEGQEGTAP